MENLIKILEAVAWPLALIVLALTVVLVVYRVTATKGEVSLKWKDWGFGAKSAIESPPSLNETVSAPPQDRPDLLEDSSSDGSDTDKLVEHPPASFWSTKSEHELETAFQKIREDSETYSKDKDLWETLRIDRRREIGVGDELAELNALADQNPTWVWPLIFKARRHQRLHEFPEAEATLSAALARSTADNRKWVLREGVRLSFATFGLERSLAFIREKILSGASDIETSSMFNALAEQTKSEDDVFSYAMLSELSLVLDKSNRETRFNLAYNYGKISDYRLTAFQRYIPLESDNDWPDAANNMGVIASASAQNGFFEEALKLGSDVSAANLARSLASDGYVHRAEALLDAASALPGASASAFIADAKAKVAKAREELNKEIKQFKDYAEKQDQRFSAAIRSAFLHFKGSEVTYAVGRFSSEDASLLVVADADGAETTFKVGSSTFSGRLARRPLCYEGLLSVVGGSLMGPTKRLVILQISETTLRALTFPEDLDKRDEVRVIELTQVTDETAITSPDSAQ